MFYREIFQHLSLAAITFFTLIAMTGCDSGSPDSEKSKNQVMDSNPGQRSEAATELIFSTYDGNTEVARFSLETDGDLRTYRHTTTQTLRDEVAQNSVYAERAELPRVRTGNTAFDALFALAVDEMILNSVTHIRDDAYNQGKQIDCECFETGEKWNYVWTRDLAYATYLGLGMLDPERARNSLEFKTSGYRDGIIKPAAVAGTEDGLQVIQDTGSGGSWPISTDRVSWAFGAEAVLKSLAGQDRESFAKMAFLALSNTIESDRQVSYDHRTGLYAGEQSFLDWREQSYATWIPDNLAQIAETAAVSTNAAHYQAIRLASELAKEFNDTPKYQKYNAWAVDLKKAINAHLWLEDTGMYSSLTASHFDKLPMRKFDWLGQTLTIITGIADVEKRQRILANYPHGPMGAPVIFPQQPGVPVYHNRAIWPFVTAFGLKAAKQGNNAAVANNAYDTLIRGAALNISNMENFEWLSAQPLWTDQLSPELAGPVVNSKRQLWSVAGYLNMVIESLFGVEAGKNDLKVVPFVTTHLRNSYFKGQSEIALLDLNWQNRKINVKITLPKENIEEQGVYKVSTISLNGKTVHSDIPIKLLTENNTLHIQLAEEVEGAMDITLVDAKPSTHNAEVFAPYEPSIELTTNSSNTVVNVIDSKNSKDDQLVYRIYRDGQMVSETSNPGSWVDTQPLDKQACYSAIAVFEASGNESHHSQVQCVLNGKEVSIEDASVAPDLPVHQQGESSVLANWGGQNDSLKISRVNIDRDGRYAIRMKYRNIHHDINTGITCGVKWVQVKDHNGNLVGEGAIQLPHVEKEPTTLTRLSTPLELNLAVGEYEVSLLDYVNMSYLANNDTYSAAGGESGALNRFDIYSLHLMPLSDEQFLRRTF